MIPENTIRRRSSMRRHWNWRQGGDADAATWRPCHGHSVAHGDWYSLQSTYIQYHQNIASRDENNPQALGAAFLHMCWYMSEDSTIGSVQRAQGKLLGSRTHFLHKS